MRPRQPSRPSRRRTSLAPTGHRRSKIAKRNLGLILVPGEDARPMLHLHRGLAVKVVLLKVGVVGRVLDDRLDGWLDLLALERDEIDGRQEGVVHHVSRPNSTEPLVGVGDEQLPDKVGGLLRHGRRHVGLRRHNLAVEVHRRVGLEGQPDQHHLVYEHAQSPPVDRARVPLVSHHLRREELARAAKGERVAVGQDLRQPKIDNLEIALGVKQQILRLEVAMGNLQLVQVAQRGRDARGVEGGGGRRQAGRVVVEQREEFAPQHQVLQHVKLGGVLEGGGEARQKGV
mmetsp:Transcript_68989/g.206908  ORF Transcript_68989/g.206908 Transcript_68989/m.206908 type:complete len:287 (+) Transcript_68989:592-1452(+)